MLTNNILHISIVGICFRPPICIYLAFRCCCHKSLNAICVYDGRELNLMRAFSYKMCQDGRSCAAREPASQDNGVP